MADKKQNGLIVIKVFKRAQEKQSETLSEPCTITVHGPMNIVLKQPRVKNRSHLRGNNLFLIEKNTEK